MSGVPMTAVKSNKRLGNVPYGLGLAAVMVVGMIGLLALNIDIQSASAQLRTDQAQAKALDDEVAALRAEVDRVGSVTSLAQQATALGMIPNTNAAFLNLADGSVSGNVTPLTGNPAPRSIPDPNVTTAPITIKIYPVSTPSPSMSDVPTASDVPTTADDQTAASDQTAEPLSADQPAGGN